MTKLGLTASDTAPTYRFGIKPPGIDSGNRISSGIGIRVQTTGKSGGVSLDIPPCGRIVVSEPVLMQSGLSVEDLTGEPYVVGDLRISSASSFREDLYDRIVTAELGDSQRSFRELVSECGIGA